MIMPPRIPKRDPRWKAANSEVVPTYVSKPGIRARMPKPWIVATKDINTNLKLKILISQ